MAHESVLIFSDKEIGKNAKEIREDFTERQRQSIENPYKSTISILGTPEHFGTIKEFLKFAAKLCPECVLYVSSESWMNAVRSKTNDDADEMFDVYVEKAFSVDEDGNVFLDTFETPRMCTLLVAMTQPDNLDTSHITCPTASKDVGNYLSNGIKTDNTELHMREHLERVMLQSQQFLMKNKTFVLLGMGHRGRFTTYADLAHLGVNIVVIHYRNVQCPSSVCRLLIYDYKTHRSDARHAKNIVNLLKNEGIDQIDAFSTFSDKCCSLSIIIQKLLQVKGLGINNPDDMQIINNKFLTQIHLSGITETKSVTSPVFVVKSKEDISGAFKVMTPPFVLKFQSSCASFAATEVTSEEDCIAKYNQIQESISGQPCTDFYWDSDSMLLMKYIDGTEYNIELVVYHGKLLKGFILDKGLSKRPEFIPTVSIYPSHLTVDLQKLLIDAAFSCVKNVGLLDGVFNVEMKMSSFGVKLIEINPRMSGYNQWYWVKKCHNIDLLFYHLLIACDIQPFVPMVSIPSYYLLGIMCHAQSHSMVYNTDVEREIANDNCVEQLIWIHDELRDTKFNLTACCVVVKDKSLSSVKKKAVHVGKKFGITSDSYNLDIFLQDIF